MGGGGSHLKEASEATTNMSDGVINENNQRSGGRGKIDRVDKTKEGITNIHTQLGVCAHTTSGEHSGVGYILLPSRLLIRGREFVCTPCGGQHRRPGWKTVQWEPSSTSAHRAADEACVVCPTASGGRWSHPRSW